MQQSPSKPISGISSESAETAQDLAYLSSRQAGIVQMFYQGLDSGPLAQFTNLLLSHPETGVWRESGADMREISKGLDQLAENPDPGIIQEGRRALAFQTKASQEREKSLKSLPRK